MWSISYSYLLQTKIYEDDPDTEGTMYCPLILGSDKTTVSVATGHVEYHPLYLSIGNVHNSVRRAHRNAVIPIGFLAIPKCELAYIYTTISISKTNHCMLPSRSQVR